MLMANHFKPKNDLTRSYLSEYGEAMVLLFYTLTDEGRKGRSYFQDQSGEY